MKSLRTTSFFAAFILIVGLACSTIIGGLDPVTVTPPPTVQVIPTETPPKPTEELPMGANPTSSLSDSTETLAPSAFNFHMATDEYGIIRTSSYASIDDFYIFFDVIGIEPGTNFQSRWYALDIEGENPNVPFQTLDYNYEEGIGNIYFRLTNSDGWPVGNYKVEIYMNDAKIGEQQFSVQ